VKAEHAKAAEALAIGKLGRSLIGGAWRDASDHVPSADPSTGELLATVSLGRAAEVDAAVASARAAFEGPWRELGPAKRREALVRLADLTAAEEKSLAQIEALDVGTPVGVGRKLTAKAPARSLAYFASWIDKIYGDVVPLAWSRAFDFTLREPVGVVAAIIPWNTPLLFVGSKVGAALACGNTVVVKPSEVAPLSVLRWAELCEKAGLPPGAVNVVPGDGETGRLLASHPGVDLVSFTGGSETGPKVAAAAGSRRVALELGGKSPALVFADADLDKAAMAIVLGVFGLSGQACAASSRLLVEASVHREVVERVVELARSLPVGDPLDGGTMLGPLASERQLRRVAAYVASGNEEGARLVAGGERPGGELESGWFFGPTIFDAVKPSMRIFRDEIFGPVLAVTPFASEEEALSLANDTAFGLAAGVFSSDLSRVHRLVCALRAGTVWVNGYGQLPTQAPFGGVKGSGHGREGGRETLETYTQVKNVLIEL
jgi:acyl-CoA reductase-like NAD-dependent aldehyde dehydrogenase